MHVSTHKSWTRASACPYICVHAYRCILGIHADTERVSVHISEDVFRDTSCQDTCPYVCPCNCFGMTTIVYKHAKHASIRVCTHVNTHVCAYVSMHVYVHASTNVYPHAHANVCTCVHIFLHIYLYTCPYTCLQGCMYTCLHVHRCLRMSAYMSTDMSAHVCTHKCVHGSARTAAKRKPTPARVTARKGTRAALCYVAQLSQNEQRRAAGSHLHKQGHIWSLVLSLMGCHNFVYATTMWAVAIWTKAMQGMTI